MSRRTRLDFLLVLVVSILVFLALSWRGEIAPVEPPKRFDAAQIERGANLAAIGDCVSCHTAPEGKPYAGGFALRTMYGVLYGTNITPDPQTGIGRWSQDAFVRAMREGVSRDGRHLYPAFPYDYFTRMTDDDLHALYAFIMTREPVSARTPEHDLTFPFNIRLLLSGWKMLFLDRQVFAGDRSQSRDWNRGAYLSETIGHCGACHTPRNLLGAERKRRHFAGGQAEGWHAPALDASSRAPMPWTRESLFRYLSYGASERHEVAAGPMAAVVHNLGAANEQDVRAIALYVASIMGAPDEARQKRAEDALAMARENLGAADVSARSGQPEGGDDAAIEAGGEIYAGACALCHGSAERRPGAPSAEALHLALSTSVSLQSPGNLIRIIFQGIAPPDGEAGPFMPGFHGALTDEQVAALVVYLRAAYTDRPPWPHVGREVRRVRQQLARGH
ncbi:MAG TPA: cytochrome c [Burkholderiales bacterium]|nr:cytochrome c [Burkholderiales bacterium]